MRLLPYFAAIVTISTAFAGCLDAETPPAPSLDWPADISAIRLPAPVWQDGRLAIDVPVPVLLVGYPEGAAAELNALLEPVTVNHWTGDMNEVFPPDPEDPESVAPLMGENWPMAILPTARYVAVDAPQALEAEFQAFLDDARTFAINDDRLHATAAEDFFQDATQRHGVGFQQDFPGVIVLHTEAFGLGAHEWQYVLPHGTLDGERLFGGKYPFLVWDASAKPDQWGTDNGFHGTYGVDELDPIPLMLEEALHFRLMQGALYPAPTADCHAITMILGVRATSIASLGILPPTPSQDAFHPEEIGRAFENLTGQTVHADWEVLVLPTDDPVLDAMARGEFATMELQRAWFEQNWQDYHVAHEDCEPYLAFVVDGDSASTPTGILGIATYDHSKGHRIAFGWVNELLRYALGDPYPNTLDMDLYGTRDGYTWLDYLFVHELGHTFTMRHAHDYGPEQDGAQGYVSGNNFEVVWDPMSYRTDGRVIDFGDIAQNNYARNRATWLLQAADAAGLEGTDAWNAAWDAVVGRDWVGAGEALTPALHTG